MFYLFYYISDILRLISRNRKQSSGSTNCTDDRGVGAQEMMLCNEVCLTEASLPIKSSANFKQNKLLNQNCSEGDKALKFIFH